MGFLAQKVEHQRTKLDLYPLSFICKLKQHYIYKAVLPVEENMQLLPFASIQHICLHTMTFRPADLSHDQHGIGWKDSLPTLKLQKVVIMLIWDKEQQTTEYKLKYNWGT